MDNIYNIVSDMDVPVGMTVRTNCPNCGQRTFTVTNNMGSLVWNCYRASCNVKGGTRVRMSADDIRAGFAGADDYAKQDTFNYQSMSYPTTGTWQRLHGSCMGWTQRNWACSTT